MSPWIPIQIVMALFTWGFAARAVFQVHSRAYWGGRSFGRTSGRLAIGRTPEVQALLAAPGETALSEACHEAHGDVMVIGAVGHGILAELGSYDRTLRGAATVATTLGMLAAIATLRTAVGADSEVNLREAAGQAMDSAVLGFVTGLPCWTAVALCRGRLRVARAELDDLVGRIAGRGDPDGGVDDSRCPK